ncbi:MAG: hypothetical protein OXQ29_15865 [Rhodospirillaceae bacterium]|nr:hypothetical protein [Rhodospirillaceae bacterium]
MNRLTIRHIDAARLQHHVCHSAGNVPAAVRRFEAIGHHLNWVADAVTRQRPRFLAGEPTDAVDLMLWRRRN